MEYPNEWYAIAKIAGIKLWHIENNMVVILFP